MAPIFNVFGSLQLPIPTSIVYIEDDRGARFAPTNYITWGKFHRKPAYYTRPYYEKSSTPLLWNVIGAELACIL
jgi:hypothetical protein